MPSKSPTNRWVEISVEAEHAAVDDLAALLGRYCQGGAVVEDRPPKIARHPSRRAIVKGFLPASDEETRQKLEIALLLLSRNSPVSEPRIRVLEPEDWAESWKAYFPPRRVGERLVIVPTWHSYDPRPGEQIIHLDPGMAFGTGLHPTTRLCLLALQRLLTPAARVLDVGTGSGILAIGAAHLGAVEVHAIDIDPVAVEVARENVILNGVEDIVQVARATLGAYAGQVPRHDGSGYHLVLANILAEIIAEMAADLAATLAPDGHLVASGIIADKADLVLAALEPAGLQIRERLQEEDWVALVAQRVG